MADFWLSVMVRNPPSITVFDNWNPILHVIQHIQRGKEC